MKRADIQTITSYIRENPDASASEVAGHFSYSPFHFSRLFKQLMGVSMREYSSGLKIERGLEALADERSVIDSQLEAGYESAGTFSNTFKRFTGISPKEHTKSITHWVDQLTRLNGILDNNILYMPFDAKHHQQPYQLDVHIQGKTSPDHLLFLGFFPQAMPKGIPNLGICMPKQTHHSITTLPNGTHYIMVVEIPKTKNPFKLFTLDNCKRDIIRRPIQFPLEKPLKLTLTLRERIPQDPPINVHPLKLLFDILNQH